MSLDIQDIALFNIIKKKRYEYLQPELIKYFTDINKNIYQVAYELVFRRVEINENTIKNCISVQSWTPVIKKMTLQHAHEIINMNIMAGTIDIPRILEETYFNTKISEMLTTFTDKKNTLDIKKKEILSMAETILSAEKVDDFHYYKDIIQDMHDKNLKNETPDNFKNIIKLEDDNLKKLYGGFIYPQYYGIVAKSGFYKTTLLLNLMHHLDELGKRSIFLSLEDTYDMIAIKILAIKTGMDKEVIVRQKYDNYKFEKAVKDATKNIIIMDKMRNTKEIYNDISNICRTNDIHFAALDYVQIVGRSKGESEYETLKDFSNTWLKLVKENKIPMMQLSQVDKANALSSGYLELGVEKGCGDFSNVLRHNISLNEPLKENMNTDEGHTKIIAYLNKVSFGEKCKKAILFEPTSGQIRCVEDYDES